MNKVLLAICILFMSSTAFSEEKAYDENQTDERTSRIESIIEWNIQYLEESIAKMDNEIKKAKQAINKNKQLIYEKLPEEKQKEAFLKSFVAWNAYVKAAVEYLKSYYGSMLGTQWTEMLWANIKALYTTKAEELKKDYKSLKYIEAGNEYIK